MKKYAFFLDIDGTLLAHDGSVPKENIEAIKIAREQGHKVFINSGRSMAFIPKAVLEIPLDGYVMGIGCYIKYKGEVIFSKAFDKNEVAKLFDKFTSQKFGVVLEGEEHMLCNEYNNYWSGEGFTVVKNGEDYLQNHAHKRITKFYMPHVLDDATLDHLKKDYTVFQHSAYVEMAPKGYTKATGVKIILDKCNIPVEYSVAIGDSSNDTDMLKYAGISVAMGNSENGIKELCTKNTTSAEQGGVGKAILDIIN